MGRSQESFNKKEVQSKKAKKKKDKEKKRLARKDSAGKLDLDTMMAYVDENGMIVDTPPDPDKKTEINVEDIQVSVPKSENVPHDITRQGIVAFFNDSKGYGFIRDLQTKESIFVHINNTVDPIGEGNKVSFEMGRGPKGPTAMNVKLVK